MNSISDPLVARQMVRGAMALRASDPERALQLFDELLRADPHNPLALRNKGRLLLKRRQHEQAEPVWATLAMVAPGDAEAHFQLARLRARAGSLEPAIAGGATLLALLGGNFVFISSAPSTIKHLALLTPNGWAIRGFTDLATIGGGLGTIAQPVVAILVISLVVGVVALSLARRAVTS